jgi:proteasome lid subunit RPN8/RPN11
VKPWDAALQDVRDHAQGSPNVEVCGYIVRAGDGFKVLRAHNIAEDTSKHAIPDGSVTLQAYVSRDIYCSYHSHPKGPRGATEQDRRAATGAAMDALIYSVPDDHFHLHRHEPLWFSLLGKPSIPGETGCEDIVRDYFKLMFEIEIPPYDRPETLATFENDFLDSMSFEWGFVRLDGPPAAHDVMTFRVLSPCANHMGVYVGDGKLLHQSRDALSSVENLTPALMRRHCYTYRHKELM